MTGWVKLGSSMFYGKNIKGFIIGLPVKTDGRMFDKWWDYTNLKFYTI